jgi:hypothetical protein
MNAAMTTPLLHSRDLLKGDPAEAIVEVVENEMARLEAQLSKKLALLSDETRSLNEKQTEVQTKLIGELRISLRTEEAAEESRRLLNAIRDELGALQGKVMQYSSGGLSREHRPRTFLDRHLGPAPIRYALTFLAGFLAAQIWGNNL